MRPLLFAILFGAINFASAQTADEYYQKAKYAYVAQEYALVLGLLDSAIALDPRNADYYHFKGYFLRIAGFHQESVAIYNIALSELPNEAILNIGRAYVFSAMKNYDLAIRDFSIALELTEVDSIRYEALHQRAVAKFKKRDFEGASQDFSKCYAMDSTHIELIYNMALVYQETDRYDESIRYLLKALAIDSMLDYAYNNLGFVYQLAGEHELAIVALNNALAIDPKQAFAYSNRSYNKLKLGDPEGAKKDIAKSIKLDPTNSYAFKNRALIHIESGKIKKACEDLQTALDKGFVQMYGEEVSELQRKYCLN